MRKIKTSPKITTPVPGCTLSFKSTTRYLSPHCFALYLGKDDTGDKVLIPTYVDGYKIVNLDSLDDDAYKVAGKFNIRNERIEDDIPVEYSYTFFDTLDGRDYKERQVLVERLNGRWTITNEPDVPSWSE